MTATPVAARTTTTATSATFGFIRVSTHDIAIYDRDESEKRNLCYESQTTADVRKGTLYISPVVALDRAGCSGSPPDIDCGIRRSPWLVRSLYLVRTSASTVGLVAVSAAGRDCTPIGNMPKDSSKQVTQIASLPECSQSEVTVLRGVIPTAEGI